MELKMYIGGVLIDSVPVNYDGLSCCAEKEQYQAREVERLAKKHIWKIKASGLNPEFFVENEPSKLNGNIVYLSYLCNESDYKNQPTDNGKQDIRTKFKKPA